MSWGNNWDFSSQKGENFGKFMEKKVKPQLKELLTNYGTISNIWFDVPFTINRVQSEELYNMVRSYQPQCIMNSRLSNGLGDYDSAGDNEIPGEGHKKVFETPATTNDTWGFKHFDHNWKSTKTLICQLVEVVSKGGNYLLNIGPDAEGIILDASVKILREISAWLQINGECIYGTEVWEKAPAIAGNTTKFYTRKNNNLYVIVPENTMNPIVVEGIKNLKNVRMLGDTNKIEFSINNGIVKIVPASRSKLVNKGLPVVLILEGVL